MLLILVPIDVDNDICLIFDTFSVIGVQPLRLDESKRRCSIAPSTVFCCVLLCFVMKATGIEAR